MACLCNFDARLMAYEALGKTIHHRLSLASGVEYVFLGSVKRRSKCGMDKYDFSDGVCVYVDTLLS